MAKAAKLLCQAGFDLIDINFACPAPKVLRREIGGFLMTKPDLIKQITSCVRDAVSCPVTLKLRAGYDNSAASREDFWRICEQAVADGIDAVTIHGRTVTQRFTGKADWSLLAEVKQKFPKLMLFGSGDLFDAKTAESYLNAKTADGIVIARGAIGNPWIFADLNALLEGKPKPPAASIYEQGQIIRRHFEMVNQLYSPAKSIRYFRKFAAAYCKLHPQRKQTLQRLLSAGTQADFLAAIDDCYCLRENN
jgi:nifR3 family TIM-barrel protein